MVKVIQDTLSDNGFPVVRWEQDVPTGESAYSVQQSATLKIAAVVMVFVFVAVYAASEEFWTAVLASFLIGGLCLAGDKMFKGGVKVWDIHTPGREPREGAAEEEQRARATAITGQEHGVALVAPDANSKELIFWVLRGGKAGAGVQHARAPLASLDSFALGTAEEWFDDIAQAQLRRLHSLPNSHVIVALTIGEGVLPVAESAGAKAEIAHLQGILTKRFLMGAREMQERWKEKLEEERRADQRS